MDPKQDPEAWADALLDAHRTAPKTQRDLPPGVQLMARLSDDEPDPFMAERARRQSEQMGRWMTANSIVQLVGFLVLFLFVIAWLGMF